MNNADARGWLFGNDSINSATLLLTDDETPTDPDFPFLVGTVRGYGHASLGSLGTKRGAWNSAGYRGVVSPTGVDFKWIYDFLPTQALGSIKTIGLTGQYNGAASHAIFHNHPSGYSPTIGGDQYRLYANSKEYSISAAGVVSIKNLHTGLTTTKDISSIVGANTANQKVVGYDASTGEFYIAVFSATSGSRTLYKFADDNFSTALTTYPITAVTSNYSGSNTRFYVNAGKAILLTAQTIFAWDFTSNANTVAIDNANMTDIPALGKDLNNSSFGANNASACEWAQGKYIVCGSNAASTSDFPIYDISTGKLCGRRTHTLGSGDQAGFNGVWEHPLASAKVPIFGRGPKSVTDHQMGWAFTSYKVPVDAPARPAGYGMTVTYEVRVDW